jgi:hypothetical protein
MTGLPSVLGGCSPHFVTLAWMKEVANFTENFEGSIFRIWRKKLRNRSSQEQKPFRLRAKEATGLSKRAWVQVGLRRWGGAEVANWVLR